MGQRTRVLTFRPDPEIVEAMERLRERDGIPFSEQIRRALRTWLESRDVLGVERKQSAGGRARGLPTWARHD